MLWSHIKLVSAAFSAALLVAASANAQPVTILHNFASSPNDGQNPGGALILTGSTLYGMTEAGGAAHEGTIFQVQTDGTNFGLTHSFAGGLNDGLNPNGSLVQSGQTLYGMTIGGGSALEGTVFQIAAGGAGFGLVHSFVPAAGEGKLPLGSLVQSGPTLYGMTSQGGTANMGTIFKINTDGTSFAQLHSFVGGAADGQHPSFSALIVSGNTLYGMTPEGGTAGQGTIFRINTDGSSFAILHTFTAASGDGWDPDGSLVLSGNTLYGMTRQGGGGAGTIFQINTDGSGYSRLHTFLGASTGDGANPVGTLTALGSLLYGTTPVGGAHSLGTIFSINMDGTNYGSLYSFIGGPNDGANPNDLIASGSTLYGMTGAGGSGNFGTVFSFTPVPEPSPWALTSSVAVFAFFLRRCRRSPTRA